LVIKGEYIIHGRNKKQKLFMEEKENKNKEIILKWILQN
jgi:hypothetical protein